MKKLTKEVLEAWDDKQPAVVFSTVAKSGEPNSIYATCVAVYENNKILVANNYFDKTITNIKDGSKGSVLFITSDDKSYQIKGNISHETSGAAFDNMKEWNPKHLPGVGVAIIEVEEVFSGAEKLI